GIDTIFQRVRDKISAYEQIKSKFSLADEQICYVGDDLVDIPVLKKVGFAVTVADGIPELDHYIHWRSHYPGGGGAIRELCELILRTQQSWDQLTQRYFG
ncbi:MAG: HAD hydrolase family protein, partial [Xanthomonadaceae bacterium]|nr:HAD hydrolase family protein [Xanthomonadaceae bacterium]